MPPPRKPLPRRPVLVGRKLEPEEVAAILRASETWQDAADTLGKTVGAVASLAHDLRIDGYDVPKRKGGRPRKGEK